MCNNDIITLLKNFVNRLNANLLTFFSFHPFFFVDYSKLVLAKSRKWSCPAGCAGPRHFSICNKFRIFHYNFGKPGQVCTTLVRL